MPLLLAVLVAFPAHAQQRATTPTEAAATEGLSTGLAFVENRGQWADEVRFRAQLGGATAWVTNDALVFDFYTVERGEQQATDLNAPESFERDGLDAATRRGHVVAMRFEGAEARRTLAHGQRSAYHNYFLGNDPSRWASRVPLYDEVVLEDLYEGVDLRLYDDGGLLRYDLVLAPGADLGQVRMQLDGADGLALTSEGALRMETSLGPVEQRGLLAYQNDASGERAVVESAFVLGADGALGFTAEEADPKQELVIDPLIWSTFLGGFSARVNAIAVSPDGNTTVVGHAGGSDFPTTSGAYDASYNGGSDVFITRLSADGSSLAWSTFLGGGADDFPYDVVLGTDGRVTIAGNTSSFDFPTTPGAYNTNGSGGFVTQIASDGSSLVWSTLFFCTSALAMGADGSFTVAGQTRSSDIPTTPGAYDTSYNGGFSDACIARLSADGSELVWSTFLGGEGREYASDLAVSTDGSVTVTGDVRGVGFPTPPGAYDTTRNGNIFLYDAFVTRLSADGGALVWSTFLGGEVEDNSDDLVVGTDGSVTISGETDSIDFPATPGAYDTSFNGRQDVFVARLSDDGSTLTWSTYLGGAEIDYSTGIAGGPDGSATVAGTTRSPGFPTTPAAFDQTCGSDAQCNVVIISGIPTGKYDAFATRLSADGAELLYSTFLGGAGDDSSSSLGLHADGVATITGRSGSQDFPTSAGAYDADNESYSPFITRLDVSGNSQLALTATALSPLTVPRGGSVEFEYTVTNATAAPVPGDLFFVARRDGSTAASAVVTSGTVPPGQSVTGTFSQQVPSNAPTGDYAYDLSIGQFPNVAVDTETFTATVTAVRAGETVEAWAVRDATPWASDATVSANSESLGLPDAVTLSTYPNPFRQSATVSVALPSAQAVTLAVYDVLGREVMRLADGEVEAGRHAFVLSATGLPSGVYLVRLVTAERTETQQVTLVR